MQSPMIPSQTAHGTSIVRNRPIRTIDVAERKESANASLGNRARIKNAPKKSSSSTYPPRKGNHLTFAPPVKKRSISGQTGAVTADHCDDRTGFRQPGIGAIIRGCLELIPAITLRCLTGGSVLRQQLDRIF